MSSTRAQDDLNGASTSKDTEQVSTTTPPENVVLKVRLQVELLEQIYDITSGLPGYTLSEAVVEAIDAWLEEAEKAPLDLDFRGQRIEKAPGEPFPSLPSTSLRTGRPPQGGRDRGPVRVSSVYMSAALRDRLRNAVAWQKGMYMSWVVDDALRAWITQHA